ncbi:hypothetical protein HY489_02970 [Candidatus Woesearchaeota archaeon]|nr:hypothetical protein [Candidatus Woesearchaeota archaeon]
MEIINTILSPPFLVANTSIIAAILGGMTLFFFGTLFDKKLIFPTAKWIDNHAYSFIRHKTHTKAKYCAHASESIATIFLIIYCYLNVTLLAEYIYAPILQRLRGILLLVCIGLLILTSWAYHHYQLHRKW